MIESTLHIPLCTTEAPHGWQRCCYFLICACVIVLFETMHPIPGSKMIGNHWQEKTCLHIQIIALSVILPFFALTLNFGPWQSLDGLWSHPEHVLSRTAVTMTCVKRLCLYACVCLPLQSAACCGQAPCTLSSLLSGHHQGRHWENGPEDTHNHTLTPWPWGHTQSHPETMADHDHT